MICDNASIARPDLYRKVKEYLAKWGHRLKLHFLPTYALETRMLDANKEHDIIDQLKNKDVQVLQLADRIYLDMRPIQDKGSLVEALQLASSRLQNVVSLKLAGTAITNTMLSYVQKMATLTHLDLGDTGITDEGVRELRHLPLRQLKYAGSKITRRTVIRLFPNANLS